MGIILYLGWITQESVEYIMACKLLNNYSATCLVNYISFLLTAMNRLLYALQMHAFEELYNFSFCVYKYNTVCAQLAGTYKMEKGP
jgi:hypothetical protein